MRDRTACGGSASAVRKVDAGGADGGLRLLPGLLEPSASPGATWRKTMNAYTALHPDYLLGEDELPARTRRRRPRTHKRIVVHWLDSDGAVMQTTQERLPTALLAGLRSVPSEIWWHVDGKVSATQPRARMRND